MKIALVRTRTAKHWEAILFYRESESPNDVIFFVESGRFVRLKEINEACEISDQIEPGMLNIAFPAIYSAPWIDDLLKQAGALCVGPAQGPEPRHDPWSRWRDIGVDVHSDRELVEVFHRKFPAPFFCCIKRDGQGAPLPIVVIDGVLKVALENGTLVPHDQSTFSEPRKSKIKRFLMRSSSTIEQKLAIYLNHNPALDLRLYKKWLPVGKRKKKGKLPKKKWPSRRDQMENSQPIGRKLVSNEDLQKIELAAREFKRRAKADREAELLKLKRERAGRRGSAVRPNSGGTVFPLGLASPEDLRRKFGPKYHKVKKVG